jgi:hypothetical protein
MATYTSSARTNYFRVKDVDAFNKWIKQFSGLETIVQERQGTVGILFDDGVPTYRWGTEPIEGDEIDLTLPSLPTRMADEVEIDFMEELALHLADEEVAVLQEVGAENLRFVNGYAIAVNNKGERRDISLENIYDLAKELGSNITKAEY